jgi:hypothetical protein
MVWKPLHKVSNEVVCSTCFAHPFNAASSCLLPVEILIHRLRIWPSSAAVMKPVVVGYWLLEYKLVHAMETHGEFLGSFLDLFNLGIGQALDLKEFLAWKSAQRLQLTISSHRLGECLSDSRR